MVHKSKVETIKKVNGKTLKLVSSTNSEQLFTGKITDFYTDEDGKIYTYTRTPTSFCFANNNRKCVEHNLEALGLNMSNLLDVLMEDCSDIELNRHVAKCKYSIDNSSKYMERKHPEDFKQRHFEAVNQVIIETIDKSTYSIDSIISGLERTLTMPAMENVAILHNILMLKIYNLKEGQKESES